MRKITIIITFLLTIAAVLFFYIKNSNSNVEREIYDIENEELIIDSQINELEKLDFTTEVDDLDLIQKEEANIDSQINELETLSF